MFLSCYTVILAPTEAVCFANFDCVNNLVFQLSPLGWLVGSVAHQQCIDLPSPDIFLISLVRNCLTIALTVPVGIKQPRAISPGVVWLD